MFTQRKDGSYMQLLLDSTMTVLLVCFIYQFYLIVWIYLFGEGGKAEGWREQKEGSTVLQLPSTLQLPHVASLEPVWLTPHIRCTHRRSPDPRCCHSLHHQSYHDHCSSLLYCCHCRTPTLLGSATETHTNVGTAVISVLGFPRVGLVSILCPAFQCKYTYVWLQLQCDIFHILF